MVCELVVFGYVAVMLMVDVLVEDASDELLVDVNVLTVVVRDVDEGALVVDEVDVDELDVALEDELEEEPALVEVAVLAENDVVLLDVGAEELVELVVKLELVLAVVAESEVADVELLEKVLDNEVLVDAVLVELIDHPDVEDDVAALLEDVVELVDVVLDGMGEPRVVDVEEGVEIPVVELDVEVMLLLLCVYASADDVDVLLELVALLVGVPMLSLVLLVLVVLTLELVVVLVLDVLDVLDGEDKEDELVVDVLVEDASDELLVDMNVLTVVVGDVDEGALVVDEVDVDELDVALEDELEEESVLVEVAVLAENDVVVLDVGAEELVELVVKLELVLAVVAESEVADVELLEKVLDNEVLVDAVLVELINHPDVEDDVAELLEDVVELVDVVLDGMGELRVVDVEEGVEIPVVELDELEDVELKDVSAMLVVEVMLLLLFVHASADDVDVPLELVVLLVGVPVLSLVLLVLVVFMLELIVVLDVLDVLDGEDKEDELVVDVLVVDVLVEDG